LVENHRAEEWQLIIVDDFDVAHCVVFQGYSLGYIGSFYLSIFRGTLVSCEDECALLLLQALKIASLSNRDITAVTVVGEKV
jgi:hypothetical protein